MSFTPLFAFSICRMKCNGWFQPLVRWQSLTYAFLLIACYLLMQLYSQDVGAEERQSAVDLTAVEKRWIKDNPGVAVGGSPDWMPFNFADENGLYEGIANDYLQLIAKKTGISLSVSIAPWSENLKKLKDNKIDLLGAVYITEERRGYLNFSQPYFEVLDFFFIRDDVSAKTLDDLKGKRVAIPKGYANIRFLRVNFPDIEIVLVETFGEAIDAVLEHRAELLYDTYGSLIYSIEKKGVNTIVPFKSTSHLGDKYIHIATRKELPELASIIQKGLDAISITERRAISQRWLGRRDDFSNNNEFVVTAQERLWLQKTPVIRFAGDPNWLPYEAFNSEGEYVGIVADYLALIEKKLGINVDIIATESWIDSVAKMKRGEIDVLSETSDSELKSHLTFTRDYISSPLVIVMSKEASYVEDIDQIEDKTIALIKDYGYVSKIANKYPHVDFAYVDSIQEGLSAVSTGKVDALVATLAQASYHISELSMNNIRIVGKTEFNTKLAFGMREGFLPLQAMFDRALDDITPDEKQQIMKKWGKHKYAEKIDYRLLLQVACVFLLIIIFTLYWNRKLAREVALRKVAEEQTRILIDKIPLQIVVTSYDGRILSANPQALIDHQLSEGEMGQYNIMAFYENEGDRDSIIEEISARGMVEQKIVSMRGVNNNIRNMMLSITPIVYCNTPALLSIAVDMTERLEFESALEKAKEYAEAASREKSEFLANMSHEIRTPMNAILGFTGLLMEEIKDKKQKSFIQTIQSAGKNLLVLINDILDLSKIEAGKLTIEKKPCNPVSQFQELNDIFSLKFKEENIELVFDIEPGSPQSLYLDEVRLRQVLFNLIGNAIKFTEKGSVRVELRTDNADQVHNKIDLMISVEDSGIGISKDQQKLIFEQFLQSSGQDGRKYGGTGLGLSISKRLVEMMGGTLTLVSQLGKGSVFTVKLPGVDIASMAAEPMLKMNDQEVTSAVNFLPANILIVDDVDDNRDLLMADFADAGFTLSCAVNGLEALNHVADQTFDLILMDIRMPVMDGYEAAAEIKKISTVPIVALTASVMADESSLLKNINFDGYLRKPVSRDELYVELSKFLPFETLKTTETPSNDYTAISTADMSVVVYVKAELEGLSEQYKSISDSNNLSEITAFANALNGINDLYPFAPVSHYAQQLLEQVAMFDIPSIQRSIKDYPQLVDRVEELAANFT